MKDGSRVDKRRGFMSKVKNNNHTLVSIDVPAATNSDGPRSAGAPKGDVRA
jgi:hypothetical protein